MTFRIPLRNSMQVKFTNWLINMDSQMCSIFFVLTQLLTQCDQEIMFHGGHMEKLLISWSGQDFKRHTDRVTDSQSPLWWGIVSCSTQLTPKCQYTSKQLNRRNIPIGVYLRACDQVVSHFRNFSPVVVFETYLWFKTLKTSFGFTELVVTD